MLFLVLSTVLACVDGTELKIELKPLLHNLVANQTSFNGWYFEPFEPTPTSATNCTMKCPLWSGDTCQESEKELLCEGEIPLNLKTNNQISFSFLPSAISGTEYVYVHGDGRTRIEFQAKYDCTGDQPFQEIAGADISHTLTHFDSSFVQLYEYDADASFINLGKCQGGGGECEVYTRLQFNTKDDVLSLKFKNLTWSASYNNSADWAPGGATYRWGTDLYSWVRDTSSRRALSDASRMLTNENVYEIREWTGNGDKYSGASTIATSIFVVAASALLL